MTIRLDHFFILVGPGAPEAELLTALGLVEGTPNDHPGQGTANRRFFFSNTGLELLYVSDKDEANNGPARRLRTVERADDPTASPIGLIIRRANESSSDPFAGWLYCPEYFNDEQCFLVGENSDQLQEPLCICMPAMSPARPIQPLQPDHFNEVTQIIVSVPLDDVSPILEKVGHCDQIELISGEPHCLQIVFNNERSIQSRDLRPDLPLIIRW